MPTPPPDASIARSWPPYAGQPGQACTLAHAELFYPERHSGISGAARAKAICASCELVNDCREWALETDQRHGVWGGLTPPERRALLNRRALLSHVGAAP